MNTDEAIMQTLGDDKPELKPCPFCGGEPWAMDEPYGYWIECSCGIGFHDRYNTENRAIEIWNRRQGC